MSSMSSIDKLLKEVYQERLNDQLKADLVFFGDYKPTPLTKKQKLIKKWKRFWNHIPDFIRFIRSYEYIDWQWKE